MILIIAACTLVAAFIHPLSWLGILVYQGVAGVMLLAARRREDLVRASQLALAVAVPSALALPYLRSIAASESSEGWMGVTRSPELLATKAGNLLFFIATFALLAYLHRAELLRLVRERNHAALMLLLSVVVFSVAYLVVRAPGMNEYKFLLELAPAAAVIMAHAAAGPPLALHRGRCSMEEAGRMGTFENRASPMACPASGFCDDSTTAPRFHSSQPTVEYFAG